MNKNNPLVTFELTARTVNGTSEGFVTTKRDNQLVKSENIALGKGTQPEAMYKITIATLEYAQRVQKNSSVRIDFELIIDQLTANQLLGLAKCKAANLQPLLARAKRAMEGLTVGIGTGNSIPLAQPVLPMSERPVLVAERGADIAPWA